MVERHLPLSAYYGDTTHRPTHPTAPVWLMLVHSSIPRYPHILSSSTSYTMRLTTAAILAPLAYAYTHHSSHSDQIQVYLHPSPSSPHATGDVPTLTPDQAKAVLTHHIGDVLSDFDEMPADEGMWGHLMGMWHGEHAAEGEGREGRVVIVDGGVEPQSEFRCHCQSRSNWSGGLFGLVAVKKGLRQQRRLLRGYCQAAIKI